ncbi:MAG: TraB/GumN family protein [Bacteriovoracaceae bacterium]|nr:TraB/GumN family protein [Bacteriovoracaceae bacterium]
MQFLLIILSLLSTVYSQQVPKAHIYTIEKNGHISYIMGTIHYGVHLDDYKNEKEKIINLIKQSPYFASELGIEMIEDEEESETIEGVVSTRSDTISLASKDFLHKLRLDTALLNKIHYHELSDVAVMLAFIKDDEDLSDFQMLDVTLTQVAADNNKEIIKLDNDDRDIIDNEFLPIHELVYDCGGDTSVLKGLARDVQTKFKKGKSDNSKFIINEDNPEDQYLLVERNKIWLPKIMELHNRGGVFVAVGNEHLKYDIGLITLLKKNGFKIKKL